MSEQAERGPSPRLLMADSGLDAVLGAMFDEVAIGESIRNDDGDIVDFRMLYLSPNTLDGAGRPGSELLGRTLLEMYPRWGESGLLEHFVSVVETGVPFVDDRIAYEDVTLDGTPIRGHWSLSISKLGDGYITAARDVTPLVAAEEAGRAAEREAESNRMAVHLLHRAALPSSLPQPAGLELAARYESASMAQPVGGDWYDAFDLGDGTLGLVIADVAGHGFDAAAFMVQVRNVVRALAFEHRSPEVVLAKANQVVTMFDEQNLFATCCYALLEPSSGTFSWASAGHLPPLHIGEQVVLLAAAVGPPLGVASPGNYRRSTVVAAPGDVFAMFTDGLVEERTQSITDSLAALVQRSATLRGGSASDVADALVAGAVDRSDDLAIICARVADA